MSAPALVTRLPALLLIVALATACTTTPQEKARSLAREGRSLEALAHIDQALRAAPADAAMLRADGVASVVIDTQAGYLSRGEAPKLAKHLGGRYVYLPNARADQIAQQVLSNA